MLKDRIVELEKWGGFIAFALDKALCSEIVYAYFADWLINPERFRDLVFLWLGGKE